MLGCRQEFTHLLYDLAAGQLEAEARETVEGHVVACATCRETLAGMRRLRSDISRLEMATRLDISASAAADLFERAGPHFGGVSRVAGARLVSSGGRSLLRAARRRERRRNWSRLLVPLAAAVLLIVGLQLLPLLVDPAPLEPLDRLAQQSAAAVTLDDIHKLVPLARRAVDSAMSDESIDAGHLANLQLVHYIAEHAVESQQLRDLRFLLDLTRREAAVAGVGALYWDEVDIVDRLSALFERQAVASSGASGDGLVSGRRALASGDYDAAYVLLAGNDTAASRPLAAYAAIHSERWTAADELLAAMVEAGGNLELIDLLRAELALREKRYDVAVDSFGRVAEREHHDRLWFHAGYLAKYALQDDDLAGELFGRTDDGRFQAHVQSRFGDMVAMSGRGKPLFRNDFESYDAGGVPSSWRLIPSHEGEFEIADVDGSRVLVVRESGYGRGRLSFGESRFSNYSFSCDFRVLHADADAEFDLTVYDVGLRHYALRFAGRDVHLVHRRLGGHGGGEAEEPAAAASVITERSTADGGWWRAVIEVRTVDRQRTEIRASVWPRGSEQPGQWQMAWTDEVEAPQQSLQQGKVSLRVAGADIAFDNLVISPVGGARAGD